MAPITFALIAFLAWGSGDIFGTVATRRLGAFPTTFWSYLSRIIIFGLYIPFAIKDFVYYTPSLLLLNLLLGLLLLIGFLTFNQGLKIANPSIVGTISAAFVGVVVLLSILFFGDHISFTQGIFISVIFAGVVLTSLDFKVLKIKNLLTGGVVLALITMLTWGVYFTFIKIIVKEVGWFWPNYISFTLVIILLAISRIKKIELPNPIIKKAFFPLIATVILTGTAEFCYNFALSKGYGSIVAPIAGAYPVLFVFLSYLVFKEPLSRQQKIGVVVSLIGITALSFM
jgi:drug/metabolite transporter (DMT)-like permease